MEFSWIKGPNHATPLILSSLGCRSEVSVCRRLAGLYKGSLLRLVIFVCGGPNEKGCTCEAWSKLLIGGLHRNCIGSLLKGY